MADPFDVSNSDLPPAQPGGISPDFWRNLALFGSSLSLGANARTPQGFLANGPGFAGPFAAGIQGAMQGNLDIAKSRSNLGLQQAQTQDVRSQAASRNIQNKLGLYNLNLTSQLYGGPQFDEQGNVLPQGQSSPYSVLPQGQPQSSAAPASSSNTPFAANNPLNIRYAGQDGATNTNGFAAFPTPEAGQAATDNQFKLYADRGVNTLNGLISTWAPPSENDTAGYVARVSKETGIAPDAPIDLHNPAVAAVIQRSMAGVEGNGNARVQVAQAGNGPIPLSGASAQQPQQAAPQPQPTMNPLGIAQGILTGRLQPTPQQALAAAPLIGRINPQLGQELMQFGLAGPKTTAEEAAKLPFVGPTEAAKAANAITTDRFGNMYQGTRYLGRGSEVKPVWNPQKQQYEYGDVGGIGIGAQAPAIGSGQTGSSGIPEKPGPMQEDFMKIRGENLAHQFDKIDTDAAAAKESNYLFDNLRNDSQSWDMGKFADFEGDARAWLSAAAQAAGIPTPGLDQKLADFQAFNKSSGMLLRSAVHETSSRAAVQEYNLIGQTLPQPTTSKQGFGQIADQWQGLSDFRLAKQKFAQGYNGKPQDFNVDFNSKVSPSAFLLNRMSQTEQGQQDMQTMMARMQQTPPGKLLAKRLLQQYQFAKSAHLFDDLPATGAPQGAQ